MASTGDLRPGDRLAGRYRLREMIGAGDMGVVWRARDEVLGRTVAVKRMGGAVEGARLQVEREARMAGVVDHPRLLRVLDVIGDSGVPWLVLQHVDAHSWASLWQREGRTGPRAAAHVAAQVAEALAALHGAGVVHGDVTPDNVLVTRDGEVKLADFGASRLVGDDAAVAQMTGLRDNRAPEVRAGAAPGTAADMYALGAAVHEAVEGTPPAGLPHAGPLAHLLDRLLSVDPCDRPVAAEAYSLFSAVAAGRVS